MKDFSPKICPVCAGFGLTTQSEGQITCQSCLGEAVWLENAEGIKLLYKTPELIEPKPISEHDWNRVLRYGLGGIAIASTFYFAFLILSAKDLSLDGLIWQKDWTHFFFGLAGLGSIWTLTYFNQHQTSKSSLHEVDDILDAGGKLDHDYRLEPYANPRLPKLLKQAALIAANAGSSQIDESILLITLLTQPRIRLMLARLEIDGDSLSKEIAGHILMKNSGVVTQVNIHPLVRKRILDGFGEAMDCNFPYLDLEDIMLNYLKDPGIFTEIFKTFELDHEEFYAISRWYADNQEHLREWSFWLERGRKRPKGYMNRAWTALPTPFLDQFSHDITRLAANGNLPSVTVRGDEMAQILQVLGRTKKNSLLLVGEPGVGKNTLVGGLAVRMIEENVPEILKDKRLLSVDLGALLSQGEAETNMQNALDEVSQAGNVILAIPDLQFLVGTSKGAMDAAAQLYQAMSRGFVQIISTATYSDYHRYIESNPSLTNLLDIIEIKEVDQKKAITILEEESSSIEGRQGVYITYPAIENAVTLAHRYLPEKMLPESAITVLDEAASLVKIEKRYWVQKDDVEKVLEQRTQIPIAGAQEKEAELLLNLENILHNRIIGQAQAVKAIAEAMRRARSGLSSGKRPIASFLFVGPTGVGKTETAKALADLYFGSADKMIRLDMSEFQDNKAVYKLIGAPASDPASYTEGGALTQPIREHPFSLVLFDEIEKAFPDVLNLFLQLLDDGRLTENTGRTVFYNNAIVVATSNAGTLDILELLKQGISSKDLPTQIMQILGKHFKPEFLNRFDAIIPYLPLRPDELFQITKLMLQDVINKAAEQKIVLSFSDDAVQRLAELGFDPLYGARPLRRVIQEKVEGLLATKILEKSIVSGESLRIDASMLD